MRLSRSHVGEPTNDLLRVLACASILPNSGKSLRLDRCGYLRTIPALAGTSFSRKPEDHFSRVMLRGATFQTEPLGKMRAQHPRELVVGVGAFDGHVVGDDIAVLVGEFGQSAQRG